MTDNDTVTAPRPARIDTRLPLGLNYLDLARIGIPALAGAVAAGPPGIVAGLAGMGLAKIRYNGKKLDQYAVDVVGHAIGVRMEQWPAMYIDPDRGVAAGNNTVLGVVKVSSVDIDMLSSAETAGALNTVTDLFKASETAVEMHARQRRVDLTDYTGVNGTAVVTDHYVVVRIRGDFTDWRRLDDTRRQELIDTLDERCSEMRRALSGGDMSADRVTGDRFVHAVRQLFAPPRNLHPRRFETGTGEVRKVVVINELPSAVQVGWLADVLNADVPGLVDVVQRVDPVMTDGYDRLEWILAKAQGEQASTLNPARRQELARVEQDIRDLLAAGQGGEPLVEYATCIVVRGNSTDEVDTSLEQLRPVLNKHRIKYRLPWFKTGDLVKHVSPVYPRGVETDLVVPGTTAAAGYPWAALDTVHEGGVVFGIGEGGVPVVLDRFSWAAPSPHMAVLGMTGSGKTVWMQTVLLRSAEQRDYQKVFVVDLKPDAEYGGVGEELSCLVDRWPVGEKIKEDPELLAEVMNQVYTAAREFDGPSIVVVDEAHKVLHDDRARQELADLVQMGRSESIAVTVMTQAASHFTQYDEEGESLLRQMGAYVFFRQQDVKTEVERFFRLTKREAADLQSLSTGSEDGFSEGIIRGPVNTELRVELTEDERRLVLRGGDE